MATYSQDVNARTSVNLVNIKSSVSSNAASVLDSDHPNNPVPQLPGNHVVRELRSVVGLLPPHLLPLLPEVPPTSTHSWHRPTPTFDSREAGASGSETGKSSCVSGFELESVGHHVETEDAKPSVETDDVKPSVETVSNFQVSWTLHGCS